MVICPYCKMEVADSYVDQRCPHCNEYVKSEAWLETQSRSFIRYLRKKDMDNKLKTHVWNGEIDEAIEEIRRVMERPDVAVEPVIISKILQEKPSNWEYTKAPHSLGKVANSAPNLITCPACNHQISTKAETCPHCGNTTGVHVCPKCGSTNTKTISSASKATSVFLWGPFAANKVVSKFQCKDCWHKF